MVSWQIVVNMDIPYTNKENCYYGYKSTLRHMYKNNLKLIKFTTTCRLVTLLCFSFLMVSCWCVCPQKMNHLCWIWGQMKVPSQLVDSSTGDVSQEDFMEVMYLETKMGMSCYLYVRIINYAILLCISLEESEKLNRYASKKQILNFHLHIAPLWVFVVIVKLQMETAIFPVLLTVPIHTLSTYPNEEK